jgi:hypothetical protein
MPDPIQLLLGLGVPLLIAAVLAWIGGRAPRGSSWGAIVGLAIGLLVAYRAFLSRWSPLPAIEAPERIVVFTVGLTIAAVLLSWRGVPWIARVLLAIAANVLIVWYVFRPMPVSSLPVNRMWTYVAITAAASLVLTGLIERIGQRSGSVAMALVLGPLAAGVGAINMLTDNAKLGDLGAAIGVMIFGWLLAALFTKNGTLSRGPVIVCMAALAALLSFGYFGSQSMTTIQLVLIAAAPCLACVAELPPVRRWKGWRQELIRLVLVVIPIGVAVGIAVPEFIRQNREATSASQEM